MTEKVLKNVAIYLRKSREDETDDALSKHRDTLLELAGKKKWKYKIYEEIVSGDSISDRPCMQNLLDDVACGMWDGVAVMDIDRLSRGQHRDWGEIFDTFRPSNTIIITPLRTYDLENDMDDSMLSMQAFFAREEYKLIRRRLQRGKVRGAKQGYWTTGTPPYPYYYDSNTKTLVADTEKAKIYRMIVEMHLSGMSCQQIVVWLNQNRIQPPRGAVWDDKKKTGGWGVSVLSNILKSEVHLGNIIFGKTKWDNYKKNNNIIKKPEEEWIRGKGKHQPLKTQEEHDHIIKKIAQDNFIPVKCRASLTPLSGLLYCKKCGYRMKLDRKKYADGEYRYIMCCYHKFRDNSLCTQKGRVLDDSFYEMLYHKILNIDTSYLGSTPKTSLDT